MDHNSISTNRPRDNGEGSSISASFSSFSANGVDIAHAGQGDAAAASYQAFKGSVDTPDYTYAYSDILEGSSGNIYVERDDPTFAERVDQEDDTDDNTTDEDTDYGLDDVDGTSAAMSDEEECREQLLDRRRKRKAKQAPGKARPARRRATMESGDKTAQQLSTFTSKASVQ